MIIGTKDLPHTFCTIYPTLTVLDWVKVEKEVIPALIEATKPEKGCVFYGFTLNKEDNLLICRANGLPILGPALDGGLMKMDSLVITGPADQLAIAKEAGDALGAVYQETMVGFSRFSV
jgi:hypothetical protein